MRLSGRSVQIVFTGSGLIRQYAVDSAPMLRAEFQPGERIRVDGSEWVVASVRQANGVLHYACGDHEFAEGQLDAEQPVSQADQRLLSGRVDRNDQFDFRFECLRRRAKARAHPGWGLLGSRIDLIPHQLRIAEIGATRRPPRLLLADDAVGYALSSAPRKSDVGTLKYMAMTKGADATAGEVLKQNIQGMIAWAHRG